MNVLASHVQAKVQSGLDTADVLLPSIESALQNISGIEEAQANSLPGVISGVFAAYPLFTRSVTHEKDARRIYLLGGSV